jgi:hypothetical protein
MLIRSQSLMTGVIAWLAAAGCDDANRPSGSVSASSTNASSSSTGADGGGSSSGGAGGDGPCDVLCEKLSSSPDCDDCDGACTGLITASGCGTPGTHLVACLVENGTNCTDMPTACEPLEDAFEACVAGGCSTADCTEVIDPGADVHTCDCTQPCAGYVLGTACGVTSGESVAECECFIDGVHVGACSQSERNICEVDGGCCGRFAPRR